MFHLVVIDSLNYIMPYNILCFQQTYKISESLISSFHHYHQFYNQIISKLLPNQTLRTFLKCK